MCDPSLNVMDPEARFNNDTVQLTDKLVTATRRKFAVREIILGGVAVLGVILFTIFASLYGVKPTGGEELNSRTQCTDRMCYLTFAHIESFLNASFRPCDNFYQFACGGYRVDNSLHPEKDWYNTVIDDVDAENRIKLIAELEKEIPGEFKNGFSSERKAKEFYMSCMDDFYRQNQGAQTLIKQIKDKLGGWYVLDENAWKTKWDLNAALKTVHTDLMVNALYRLDVYNGAIEIHTAENGGDLYLDVFTHDDTYYAQQLLDEYRTYMETIATLTARDSGVTADRYFSRRVRQFISDVMYVERQMAWIHENNLNDWLHSFLGDLTDNVINWTAQVTYMFNDPKAHVNKWTPVWTYGREYFTDLSSMIQNGTSSDRNRTMHNYLTWRILDKYSGHLSMEYFHAHRKMRKFSRYYDASRPFRQECLTRTLEYFDVIVGALFVASNFEEKSKSKVASITSAVKQSLEDLLAKNSWMDAETRRRAVEKVGNSTYLIGYPDGFMNRRNSEVMYENVNVSRTDYLRNLIECQQFYRRELNKMLTRVAYTTDPWDLAARDSSDWVHKIYKPEVEVSSNPNADEITVSAGFLQFPIFALGMPHYYSFGTAGALVARASLKLVYPFDPSDSSDRYYGYFGHPQLPGWWSDSTSSNYTRVRQCVQNLTRDHPTHQGQEEGDPDSIIFTSSIRLAYNAYKSWVQKYGEDPYPLGFGYTPEQIFFIAKAQLHCNNGHPFFNNAEEMRVNTALQELPEFAQAFSCKPTDRMVHSKPCTYN